MTDTTSPRGIDRRRLIGWSGLAAAGVPLLRSSARPRPIPPETRPGGAYDRYLAHLAAEGQFSGVVLLSHRGRTVLSRSYGMADVEKGIPNRLDTSFNLSSAGKPFSAVALLQLAQQGRLRLSDTVGRHLTGFSADIADQVTIHHILSGTSGLNAPDEDTQRVFRSRDEVHEYYVRRARQSTLMGVPGAPDQAHAEPETTIGALIVEAVSGMQYWDYVQEHIVKRAGMTRSAFYTRPQWLADPHIAQPYMELADGRFVDAVRHLDQGSPHKEVLGKNPGRAFIAAPGDGGFGSAPDLVRFATAVLDGTLLDRPWADVLFGAKLPLGPNSFAAYGLAVSIQNGQWEYERAGGDPGVGANWSIYPDSGWIAVTLINRDSAGLVGLLGQETQAITGAPASGAGG